LVFGSKTFFVQNHFFEEKALSWLFRPFWLPPGSPRRALFWLRPLFPSGGLFSEKILSFPPRASLEVFPVGFMVPLILTSLLLLRTKGSRKNRGPPKFLGFLSSFQTLGTSLWGGGPNLGGFHSHEGGGNSVPFCLVPRELFSSPFKFRKKRDFLLLVTLLGTEVPATEN